MQNPAYSYPLFVCDIGGTNCRVAAAAEAGAGLASIGSVKTDQFTTFEDAIQFVSQQSQIKPATLIVCAAGPLQARSIQLTNADWRLDGQMIAATLGLTQGLLLNDFEAMAYTLPVLTDEWLEPIVVGEKDISRPQIILGPGTGLGMAGLISVDSRFRALASEAGHTDFAALDEAENKIWAYLREQGLRVTPETFLSGPGLVNLHEARCPNARRQGLTPEDITAAALANAQSAEGESVRMFWNLLARFAGDMALTSLAAGGVTLAGGILPRIIGLLDKKKFKTVYTSKSPMAHVVEPIPVRLLMQPDAVLHGMAAIAENPERYAIDYAQRNWR